MQLKKISMLLAAFAAVSGAVAPMSVEAATKPPAKKVSTASPKPAPKCKPGYVLKIKTSTVGGVSTTTPPAKCMKSAPTPPKV